MQVLWSRTQARAACRCGSCLHALIARRTTTAASKRRFRISDVFTACYSTILATAAFADAKAKKDRSKEWDRVIAEVKAAMPVNNSEYVEGGQPLSMPNPPGPRLSSDGRSSLVGMSGPQQGTPTWGSGRAIPPRIQETSLESKLRTLDTHLREASVQPENITSQDDINSTSEVDWEAEWDEELPDEKLPPREPLKKLHLDKMEEMVAHLVDQLLLQTSIFSTQWTAILAKHEIKQQMNDVAQRLESLQTGFTPVPAYSWEDVKSVKEQRSALHSSLKAICRRTHQNLGDDEITRKASIDLMVAKICYNLLISTAPPSIATYNTLLYQFNRLRQPNLAQVVVDSLYSRSKLKPDRKTGRLIIDHYRIAEDSTGFQTTSQQMGGHHKSLHIKRVHKARYHVRWVQEWVAYNKVMRRGNFSYQKMPRDVHIFDSLIQGSLELKGVRHAIRYVRAALREGCEIRSETLCDVIQTCISQFDFVAGTSLLRAFLSWAESTDFSTSYYTARVRGYIHGLLNLCGIGSLPTSQQNLLPPRIPRDALQMMLSHMQIQSIEDSVDQFENFISSLEGVIHGTVAPPSTIPLKRTGRMRYQAFVLLRKQTKSHGHKPRQVQKNTTINRWIRLRSLEWRLEVHGKKISARQLELLPVMFARLSAASKNLYLQSSRFGEVMGTPEKLELVSRLLRKQAADPRRVPLVEKTKVPPAMAAFGEEDLTLHPTLPLRKPELWDVA